MAVKYTNIVYFKALQNFPIWDFWYENKPSGNPALERTRPLQSPGNGKNNL
jgi:hypothetical protein